MPTTTPTEWYADGLRFACTQCGNCCSGPPGVVWFDDDEAQAIADFLKITKFDLLDRYCKRMGARWSLDEVQTEHGLDCVFLERDPATGKAGCSIYPVRPTQCRTWPFWPELLSSRRAWERAGRTCPGITAGDEGKGTFYPIEQIRVIRDANP
jgi:Fe-S-cluster containining protein